MEKLKDKKTVNKFTALFMITYFVSYITRINYGAVIAEMERETGMVRTLLSMAVTGSFITYGIGQVISGFFGDKIQPKKLIITGLVVTVLMNLTIPFLNNPYVMTIVWSINGLAQAFMWPPIVKLMITLFTPEDYRRGSFVVSWGSALGTIFVYLSAPVFITFTGYRGIFIFSALAGILMIFFFNKICIDIDMNYENKELCEDEKGKGNLFSPLFIMILIAIILQGSLRDGVTTWMPSFISDTFNISSKISILTGVLMPVFGVICSRIALYFYRKTPDNPLYCSMGGFLIGGISSILLFVFKDSNAIISVFLTAVLTGAMHGVNLMLICMVPPYFDSGKKASLVSGIINSCTYIGSALSTYGIAVLSEGMGWNFTVLIWSLTAICGTIICSLCLPLWKKLK